MGKRGACKCSALWRAVQTESALAKFPHREGRGTATQAARESGWGRGGKGATICKSARSARIILLLCAQFHQRCVRIRTHSRGPLPSDKICSGSPSSKNFAKQCEGEGGNCRENCGGRSAENCYRGREGEFPSSIRNQVPVKPYFVKLENHFHENAILLESDQLSQSKQVPYLGHEDD